MKAESIQKLLNLLHNNKTLASMIIKANKNNLELAESLHTQMLIDNDSIILDIDAFKFFSVEVQKEMIKKDPHLYFKFSSDEIKSDVEFIKELNDLCISNHKRFYFNEVSPELFENPEFIEYIKANNEVSLLSIINSNPHLINKLGIEYTRNLFFKYIKTNYTIPDIFIGDDEYIMAYISNCDLSDSIRAHYFISIIGDKIFDEKYKSEIKKRYGSKLYNSLILKIIDNDISLFDKFANEEINDLIASDPHYFFEYMIYYDKILENPFVNSLRECLNIKPKSIKTPEHLSDLIVKFANALNKIIEPNYIRGKIINYWNEINEYINEIITKNDEDMELEEQNGMNIFVALNGLLKCIEDNTLDKFFLICNNNERKMGAYTSNFKNIEITDDNLVFLQYVCCTPIIEADMETINFYNKLYIKYVKYNNDPYLTVDIISKISNHEFLSNMLKNINLDLLDDNQLSKLDLYVNTIINNYQIKNLEELDNIEKLISDISDMKDDNYYIDKMDKFLMKYLHMNIELLDNINNKYFNLSDDSELYKVRPELLNLKNLFKKIISVYSDNIVSDETISEITTEIIEISKFINYESLKDIIFSLKNTFGTYINNSLYVEREKAGIVDITDKEFNLLIHVVGAYGKTPDGGIYDSWNTKEKTSSVSICTSLITNKNIGTAFLQKESVILGFSDLPEGFLEIMGSIDLVSLGVFEAERPCSFQTPGELEKNTRRHNELVIRRRTGIYTENKLQPSYVICFDEIDKKSRAAAEQFGIPILFIDRERLVQKNREELDQTVNLYNETKNPSLISKIICDQQTYTVGIQFFRNDLVKKYFSKEYRQNNLNAIFNNIKFAIEREPNNPENIKALNEFVKAVEQEIGKADQEYKYDLNYEEMLEEFKNHPSYNEKYKQIDELSPEEEKRKFLELLEKTKNKEKIELDEINNKKVRSGLTDNKKVGL